MWIFFPQHWSLLVTQQIRQSLAQQWPQQVDLGLLKSTFGKLQEGLVPVSGESIS